MEEIFIAIMERIAGKMPELSYIDGNLLPPSLQDEFLLTVCVPSEAAALLGYNSRSHYSALHPHSELQVMPQFPPSGFLMPQFPMSGLPQLPLNCPG